MVRYNVRLNDCSCSGPFPPLLSPHSAILSSLAEVYESEFMASQSKEEKENPAHVEIRKKMDALFVQLDALANFHFTPKPAAADVTVHFALRKKGH